MQNRRAIRHGIGFLIENEFDHHHHLSDAVRHGVRVEVVASLLSVLPMDLIRKINEYVRFEEGIMKHANRLGAAVCLNRIPCFQKVIEFYDWPNEIDRIVNEVEAYEVCLYSAFFTGRWPPPRDVSHLS